MLATWNSNGLSLLTAAQRDAWHDDPAFDIDDDGASLWFIAQDGRFLVGAVSMHPDHHDLIS